MRRIHLAGGFFLSLGILLMPAGSAFAFTLSQNLITVPVGTTAFITSSVSNNMSLGNTNSGVATVSLSGAQLTITGVAGGQSTITVCVTTDGCQNVTITVPTPVTNTSTSNTVAVPTFDSGSSLSMITGNSQAVGITGAGGYTVSSNSNPNVVGATISNNSIYLMANSAGGANINICDQSNRCSILFVSVTGNAPASTVAPTIVSFSVNFLNNQSGFLGIGSSLLISFSTNVPIVSGGVDIGNSQYSAVGTGTGPYTVSYTVNGSEPTPLPIKVSVSDSSSNTASFPFVIGNIPAPVVSTAQTASVSSASTGSALYTFTMPLYAGMQNADVMALQKRLTALGIYSGPITGFYGSLTENAVKKYQARVGLSQLGNVGPATRAALNAGK